MLTLIYFKYQYQSTDKFHLNAFISELFRVALRYYFFQKASRNAASDQCLLLYLQTLGNYSVCSIEFFGSK